MALQPLAMPLEYMCENQILIRNSYSPFLLAWAELTCKNCDVLHIAAVMPSEAHLWALCCVFCLSPYNTTNTYVDRSSSLRSVAIPIFYLNSCYQSLLHIINIKLKTKVLQNNHSKKNISYSIIWLYSVCNYNCT